MNNRDRLTEARAAFEQLKIEYHSSGAKVNISSVAERAKIDRKYLYGKINTPDRSLIESWTALGVDIREFCNSLKESRQEKRGESVTCELRNALIENYSLLENVRDLEKDKGRLQKLLTASQLKVDELERRTRKLESLQLQTERSTQVVVNLNSPPHLISPYSERGGSDKLSLTKAWVQAMNKLRRALERPVEKTLFITVGAPGSGKSSWCKKFLGGRDVSILFDACNLTLSDRFELLDAARQQPVTRIVAVVFYMDWKTLEARNSTRKDAEKLPVSRLRAMFNSIEYPSFADNAESFDEIIMLRS